MIMQGIITIFISATN